MRKKIVELNRKKRIRCAHRIVACANALIRRMAENGLFTDKNTYCKQCKLGAYQHPDCPTWRDI